MSDTLIIEKLEEKFSDTFVNQQSIGGGCIANARVFTFASGFKTFVKSGFSNGMFKCEANGLKELAKAKAVRVPKVYLADDHFIAMEYIETGNKSADFMKALGKQFALLHQHTSESFGFSEDNFIGSNPQQNIPSGAESNDWLHFYWNKRLKFQYELAAANGHLDTDLKKSFKLLEKKMCSILAESQETPCLLHGDLWSGNYMADQQGQPVLIDPAVYYGHREADLAMTKLFGGFSPAFYEAYQKTYPLKDGWQYREQIYQLYHIMNHLNLFGVGYYKQTLDLIRYYL